MTNFWLGAASLLCVFLLFVILPFWRFKSDAVARDKQKAVSNPEIIKQRLTELSGEKNENLLSDTDYQEAIKETKLQLADELQTGTAQRRNVGGFAWLLGAICLLATIGVFYQVNQVDEVSNWRNVNAQLSTLGQRIVVQGDTSVTRQELMHFALGLRTKLNTEDEDAVGWLLLGRVLSSLNDLEGALGAFQRSLKMDPNRTGTLFSYAQTLLLTEDADNARRAKNMLLRLRQMTPDDNNVLGLLAVVHTRLGENELALTAWETLKRQSPPGAPILTTIEQQIARLNGTTASSNDDEDVTRLSVSLAIHPSIAAKVPATGYLFLFIQDADSQMKMPAAVKKQALSGVDFNHPVTLTLSNDDAMLQEFNLSNLKNGRLIARVSKDENVAIQTGELQGEVVIPIKQGILTEHSLTIDKELL